MTDQQNQTAEHFQADCPVCGAIGPDYCERANCEDPRYVQTIRNGMLLDIKYAERGVKEAEEDLAESKLLLESARKRLHQHDQAQQECLTTIPPLSQ